MAWICACCLLMLCEISLFLKELCTKIKKTIFTLFRFCDLQRFLKKNREKFNIFLLGSNTETSLNDLFACLVDVTGYRENPHYGAIRAGDIKNMVMTYSKANQSLNWTPGITLSEGIVKLAEEN